MKNSSKMKSIENMNNYCNRISNTKMGFKNDLTNHNENISIIKRHRKNSVNKNDIKSHYNYCPSKNMKFLNKKMNRNSLGTFMNEEIILVVFPNWLS